MRNILFFAIIIALASCQRSEVESAPASEQISTEKLEQRLSELAQKAINNANTYSLDSTRIPRSVAADGSLIASGSRDWTSGFYPGTLWQLYNYSNEQAIMEAAQAWTAFQEKEKMDTHTHDLGFKIFCSFGEGYANTASEDYKQIIIEASKTLIKRYNEEVGAIRSWDWNKEVWQFPVIIDNMMNLEMLFEATRLTGDSIFYDIAYQHAMTTLDHHFRADHSSYHVIDYDTLSGNVRNRHTHQGAAHESAWARGQAWGLYGYTMAYGITKEPKFLEAAKSIAQFFFEHPNMPEDKVPYWDFDAPNIPEEPRDASAAAVAASGLLELMQYDQENQDQYLEWVDTILTSLATEEYQSSTIPYILDHSVGSVPGEFEVDVPLVYADYYYVEALLRRLAIEKTT